MKCIQRIQMWWCIIGAATFFMIFIYATQLCVHDLKNLNLPNQTELKVSTENSISANNLQLTQFMNESQQLKNDITNIMSEIRNNPDYAVVTSFTDICPPGDKPRIWHPLDRSEWNIKNSIWVKYGSQKRRIDKTRKTINESIELCHQERRKLDSTMADFKKGINTHGSSTRSAIALWIHIPFTIQLIFVITSLILKARVFSGRCSEVRLV